MEDETVYGYDEYIAEKGREKVRPFNGRWHRTFSFMMRMKNAYAYERDNNVIRAWSFAFAKPQAMWFPTVRDALRMMEMYLELKEIGVDSFCARYYRDGSFPLKGDDNE